MRRAICGGLLLALSASPLGAGRGGTETLIINVSPAVAFAPARITVRASVERDTDNRALEITVDSPDYYRSSTVHLEGDRAATITVVQFKNLPLGEYRVSARLFGAGDKILATMHRAVIVTEPRRVIAR